MRIWKTGLAALAICLAAGGCAPANNALPTPAPTPEPTQDAATEPVTPPPAAEKVETIDGLEIAFPADIYAQLLIVPGREAGDAGFSNLAAVYEKASYEAGMEDLGYPMGWLFSISCIDQAQYEQYLTADGSGMHVFAREGDVYYRWDTATDVQFYRSGDAYYSEEEGARWWALLDAAEGIQADFTVRNGLTPYSDRELLDREFLYEGEHRYALFSDPRTAETYTLILSQPVKQGEGGIWCVEQCTYDTYGTHWYSFSMEGSPTPQDLGIPAAEHYQSLQEQADRGERPDLLDPRQAAAAWVRTCLAYADVTLDDVALLADGGE